MTALKVIALVATVVAVAVCLELLVDLIRFGGIRKGDGTVNSLMFSLGVLAAMLAVLITAMNGLLK